MGPVACVGDVSWRRVGHPVATYLESDSPSGLRHPTPEHLPVAKTLYDVQS